MITKSIFRRISVFELTHQSMRRYSSPNSSLHFAIVAPLSPLHCSDVASYCVRCNTSLAVHFQDCTKHSRFDRKSAATYITIARMNSLHRQNTKTQQKTLNERVNITLNARDASFRERAIILGTRTANFTPLPITIYSPRIKAEDTRKNLSKSRKHQPIAGQHSVERK